jgi:hypothetical protein
VIADAVFDLATLVAKKIAEETGADKAKTYEIAIEVAKAWVAKERQAVTEARARAKARVKS